MQRNKKLLYNILITVWYSWFQKFLENVFIMKSTDSSWYNGDVGIMLIYSIVMASIDCMKSEAVNIRRLWYCERYHLDLVILFFSIILPKMSIKVISIWDEQLSDAAMTANDVWCFNFRENGCCTLRVSVPALTITCFGLAFFGSEKTTPCRLGRSSEQEFRTTFVVVVKYSFRNLRTMVK